MREPVLWKRQAVPRCRFLPHRFQAPNASHTLQNLVLLHAYREEHLVLPPQGGSVSPDATPARTRTSSLPSIRKSKGLSCVSFISSVS